MSDQFGWMIEPAQLAFQTVRTASTVLSLNWWAKHLDNPTFFILSLSVQQTKSNLNQSYYYSIFFISRSRVYYLELILKEESTDGTSIRCSTLFSSHQQSPFPPKIPPISSFSRKSQSSSFTISKITTSNSRQESLLLQKYRTLLS